MISFPTTVSVAFATYITLVGWANAQSVSCGGLPEEPCSALELAVDNWLEVSAETANAPKLARIEYVGDSEHEEFDDARQSMLKLEGQYFLRYSPADRNMELVTPDEVASADTSAWPNEVSTYLENVRYLVQATWSTNEAGEFTTPIFLTDQWPYLIDTMLSSIVLEGASNSCMHKTLYWIWGGVRGEIFVDLIARNTSDGLICLRISEAWMNFGDAKALAAMPTVKGQTCTTTYNYAWTTPLASISVGSDNVSLEIKGIGSNYVGTIDCATSP
ncbi:hypothetical protein ACUXV3_16525 [Roseobacteraceae bacterium NS-SX3]